MAPAEIAAPPAPQPWAEAEPAADTTEPAAAESSEGAADAADAGAMMASMSEVSGLTPGDVSQGHVVKVTDAEVIVDIGLKSEGAIPRAEFLADDGQLTVKPGDVVDVLIEDYDEQEGTFTVSHRKAAVIRAWEDLEKSSHHQNNVKGRVVERTKGGLTVSIGGVRAFLPSSQADLRPLRNLDALIGQEIECRVIKLNRARNNVVVSRKSALEEEANRLKTELAANLTEGAEVTGRVKNLTGYGAFVDLGGMDGLLHVTDLAWGRVGHPSEVVKVGQELRLKVLKYDREKERISLGLKQLLPDPWERVVANYRPGDHLKGRVVSLTDYGAFCEIEPGIEGLIHVSEMTWSRRLKHPSKFVNVGDKVEVSVIEVHPQQRRISLSLRQSLGDPWTTLSERLAPGARVEGRVRNLTEYGAFVEIEDGIEGLIHISDMSWTKNPKHPSEILKKGQKVTAVVLSVDPNQRRISLGLKQLEPDAWQAFFDQTPVGSVLPGKVVRLAQFGAFVELREGIEGLCHVSEMGDEHGRGGKSTLKAGMELPFRVVKVSREERKVGLSLKEAEPREETPAERRARPSAPEAPPPAASTTMGEKMAQAIRAAAARAAARTPGKPAAAPAVQLEPQTNALPEASSGLVAGGMAPAAESPRQNGSGQVQASGTEGVADVHARVSGADGFGARAAGSAPAGSDGLQAEATLAAAEVKEPTDDAPAPPQAAEEAKSGASAPDENESREPEAGQETLSAGAQS
ncbi:MAG TPA: 30S ribosomal protein S1 [Terriglobia bacterium]|nr:30S ribosomal protein S1 [Terriglobia bacterium]